MRRVHLAQELPLIAKVLLVQDLRLPIHICLGHYEAAAQEELDELITDLTHERERRQPRAA
jgi:hypothetical protein